MCADELSSKREPYFPGNYEWAPGGEVGEGARSGRDGYTREGARTSRQKIFFPFLVASLGISFSLKHNPPPPPPPRAATPRPPPSLPPLCPCFAASARFSCRAPCIFAKIGRVERRNGGRGAGKKKEKKEWRLVAVTSFWPATALVRWPGRLIEPGPTPRRCHKRVGFFFFLSFFPLFPPREKGTALLRQITHRGFLNFPLF